MSDSVIKVEALGKKYFTGMGSGPGDLRESLVSVARRLARRLGATSSSATEDRSFWALRDIDFEVARGDVLGIVGRNGAGKSTLLKIPSRITSPTCGRAWVEGRVGSLLEVGTGFHPELSGRENTYLNATILGMTVKEIDQQYESIVEYAGIRTFMETPVKRYSSGMRVRLAFAIAAHINPEILILDEVLTVGDAEFRRKSSQTIFEFAESNNTILFVSHNLDSVRSLCNRVLYLDHGRMRYLGDTDTAIDMYLSDMKQTTSDNLLESERGASMQPVISALRLLDERGRKAVTAEAGGPVTIEVELQHDGNLEQPILDLYVRDARGAKVSWISSATQCALPEYISGRSRVRVRIDTLPLLPGAYSFTVTLGSKGAVIDRVRHAAELQIVHADVFGTGRLQENIRGPVIINARFDATDL